jgi:uncharacterized membrane protein YedE/YeeE
LKEERIVSDFTPISATLGGLLIGAGGTLLLVCNGRLAGVSGIVAGTIRPKAGEFLWRLCFVLGMVAAGALLGVLRPGSIEPTSRSAAVVVIAGLLVGFGSQLGGGCTSGHGVCGMSRFSKRSIVATLMFMATGAATVFLTAHGGGVR